MASAMTACSTCSLLWRAVCKIRSGVVEADVTVALCIVAGMVGLLVTS
jgi:hypothetical protein